MTGDDDASPIRVFVHLARDKDVDKWRTARASGSLIGLNDATPYGYGRAAAMGCSLTFSRIFPEGSLGKLVRLGLRAILGFDHVHAWQQRAAMRAAEIVWTHTESQFLAVAAVIGPGPKILGQSVWLFDRWAGLSGLRRAFFRRLIRRVDLLTVHSDDNLAIARAAFPDHRVELVRFGIPSENMVLPTQRSGPPIRVLALGNDRHRDWATLIEAVRGEDEFEVLICSGTIDRRLAAGVANVRIGTLTDNADLVAEMARATVMCVPLQPNHHASGITVIEEAVIMGVPVIASETGGLAGYFGDDAVRYVKVGDAAGLRSALREIGGDPAAATAMAVQAQAHLVSSGGGAEGYVRRHVELSRELCRPRH